MYNQIDFETFELVQGNTNTFYFKDQNNVYLESYMNPFSILKDAEPEKFDYYYNEKIPFYLKDATIYEGGSYQKVNNEIYFAFSQKMNCDSFDFKVVDSEGYAYDKMYT